MPKPVLYDRWLFFTTGLLVVAGLFMVGSASQFQAMSLGQQGTFYLIRHALFALAGTCVLLIAMNFPYARLNDRRVVVALVAATLVTLVAVLSMPEAGGARRWFRVGPFSLQPAELAKLTAIVFMAWLLARHEDDPNDARKVLAPAGGVLAAMLLLITIQPDLGSSVILAATAGTMIFVAGLRWSHIGAVAGIGAVGLVAAIIAQPYRVQRIFTFFNREADLQGAGFQLNQSLLALGSGGWTGVGFGRGQQKAFYLPAAHTDFIFSVIGEEFGLLGTMLLLLAVGVLFWRGLRAALHAPDRFAFHLALGCTTLVVLQSLVHMGVCVGVFPTKGIPLPLVSYGGSSLLAMMAAMGLLLNVSRHSN